jgi:hypothetical protein
MTMTVPSSESDSQKQQTVVATTTTTKGGAVNPPKFRRIYSNTFSTIVWGASASSIIAGSSSIKSNKPEGGDAPSLAGSITPRTTTQTQSSSSGSGRLFGFASRLSSAYSSSSSLDTFATRKGEVDSKYYGHHGEVVIKQVPTKGEASSDSATTASYLNRSERWKSDIDQKKKMAEHDDSESTGARHFLQMVHNEAEKRFTVDISGFPFWKNPKLDNSSEIDAPTTRRKSTLLVSFNRDADNGGDDEEDGGNGKISVQKNRKRTCCLGRCCAAIVLVLSITGGITTTALVLGDNLLYDKKSAYYSTTHQQDMLELAEQITIACGGDSGMSNCQNLCHDHMCCVEQEEEEYSCKNDVTRDCAVYAGCVALIDDSFS